MEKIKQILNIYLDDDQVDVILNEIMPLIKEQQERELKSRREQIADINQWSSLLLNNRPTIRERVLWSMIADINNRTTD